MGFLDKSSSSHAVNGLNLITRFLQFAFGVIVLGIYAEAKSHRMWLDVFGGQYRGVLDLAIAAGALSIITGLLFAVIPFLVSYYYVAIAFIWDWIIFFVWCATFAMTRHYFTDERDLHFLKDWDIPSLGAVVAGQWFALTAMLLFLISAIMGPTCLLLDRKSLFASRAGV